MITEAMREIFQLALSLGIRLPENIVETTMTFVDSLPAEGTASLQRDIAAGLPSEIDAWNGVVERLGREAGVATPLNAYIYRSLLPLQKLAVGELSF
jgi:2-dehydropantoate 2-reductase